VSVLVSEQVSVSVSVSEQALGLVSALASTHCHKDRSPTSRCRRRPAGRRPDCRRHRRKPITTRSSIIANGVYSFDCILRTGFWRRPTSRGFILLVGARAALGSRAWRTKLALVELIRCPSVKQTRLRGKAVCAPCNTWRLCRSRDRKYQKYIARVKKLRYHLRHRVESFAQRKARYSR